MSPRLAWPIPPSRLNATMAALNCAMLTPQGDPVPLPQEKFLWSSPPSSISLSLFPHPPGAPLSIQPHPDTEYTATGGTLYVSQKRILYVAPLPRPHSSSSSPSRTPTPLDSLSVPLRAFLDGRLVQPWFTANYYEALCLEGDKSGGLDVRRFPPPTPSVSLLTERADASRARRPRPRTSSASTSSRAARTTSTAPLRRSRRVRRWWTGGMGVGPPSSSCVESSYTGCQSHTRMMLRVCADMLWNASTAAYEPPPPPATSSSSPAAAAPPGGTTAPPAAPSPADLAAAHVAAAAEEREQAARERACGVGAAGGTRARARAAADREGEGDGEAPPGYEEGEDEERRWRA